MQLSDIDIEIYRCNLCSGMIEKFPNSKTVSIRLFGSQETIDMSLDEFVSKVKETIKNKEYNIK